MKWNPPEDDGGVPIEYYQVEKMDTETGIIGLRRLSKFKFNNGETFSMSNFFMIFYLQPYFDQLITSLSIPL